MKKLLELLNEYENQLDLKWCTRSEQPNFIWHIKAVSEYSDNILYNADLAVTSKRYWFIKWLVENKKVDLYKLPIRLEEYYQSTEAVGYITDDENILLMELAIQDEPISFLISILK
jgi:hypothetical protein